MEKKNLSIENLSKLTIFSKYARHLEEKNRRETWQEICDRVENMHIRKFPHLKKDIKAAFKYVREKKVVPSMRSMQFGGKPIEINNARLYNCSFIGIERPKDFAEVMFLLLGGSGVGFSVQKHYVEKLPEIKKPSKGRKFVIGDSIEGWADAVRALFKAYFTNRSKPLFDYSDIRPSGSILKTAGGKAPGPEPLRRCLNKIESILDSKKDGEKLKPLEVHDIICLIADAVLSGGIRRSALISIFDQDDEDMLNSKGNFAVQVWNGGFHWNPTKNAFEGEVIYKHKAHYINLSEFEFREFQKNKTLPWYYFEQQRARANNSVVLERDKVTKEQFSKIFKTIQDNGSGEPGFFWTNDVEFGVNPCAEISLRSRQFCNLTEINLSSVESQEDLINRVWAATVIGTLQASYVDFHYLSSEWQKNAEDDPLLGVSLTGIADIDYTQFNWDEATKYAKEVNEAFAQKLGLKPASRLTTVKPSGTTSLTLGTASGIHARHSKYYIRNIRYNKQEPIAQYLMRNHPEIVEDEIGNDLNIVVSLPVESPDSSIFRDETSLEFLERVKFFLLNWIKGGHIKGSNTHNVSCTVNIKDEEWKNVEEWMWNNRELYNVISVFPYFGGTYKQAPFQEITEEEFNNRCDILKKIDLTRVKENEDNTQLKQELACHGNQCEVNF